MIELMRCVASVVIIVYGVTAHADPVHARTDGNFWHHDSGWVFPRTIGEFALVGVPQDVAGSRDAVAWYARESQGARVLAAVDVFPADSAAGEKRLEDARSAIEKEFSPGAAKYPETSFAAGPRNEINVTRMTYGAGQDDRPQLVSLYYVAVGEWRVRIRITAPRKTPDTLREMDDFVRAQRWETLAGS